MDAGHPHRGLHDGEPVALAGRVFDRDGVTHRHAQVVGGLAGEHQPGPVLLERSLLEGGRPHVTRQVDGLERHLDAYTSLLPTW